MHLHGGPDSPVAEYKGIQRIAGERLIGLTFDEAKTWAQKSLPAKEYDILFGDGTDDESGDTTFKTFCLTRSAKRILDEKVSREGRSSSAIINELLEQLGRD